MSDPILFLSTAAMTDTDFVDFVGVIGGVVDPGETKRGRLSEGARHAWLFFSPEAVRDAIEEHGDALAALLGGPPRSAIVAEMSGDPDGRAVALRAAAEFAVRWPQVVIEEDGALLRPSATVPGAFELAQS